MYRKTECPESSYISYIRFPLWLWQEHHCYWFWRSKAGSHKTKHMALLSKQFIRRALKKRAEPKTPFSPIWGTTDNLDPSTNYEGYSPPTWHEISLFFLQHVRGDTHFVPWDWTFLTAPTILLSVTILTNLLGQGQGMQVSCSIYLLTLASHLGSRYS